MNTEVSQRLIRARVRMLLECPFFGELALRLTLTEDSSVKTMAVDGKSIFYNPEFVGECSDGLVRAILAHEVMHCVYEHIGRRAGRDPKRWNIAGDYVINPILIEAGFDFEGKGLLNQMYAGMTTDQVYNLLADEEEEGKGAGTPGTGEPGGALDDILDGNMESTETNATDWKVAVIQAASNAEAAGKLPASLKRFIGDILAPKVDWRALLRRFITETSKDDYSWMRPNRMFMGQGLFLPSLHSESMGEVVVAIDTSGSIDQATLDAFASEIKAIVANARPSKTTVIYCDSVVNHIDEFEPNDELHFELHGGGGTDFRPPFAHVEKAGITPVCFIYLTDLYGPFGGDPGYPVLWCATTNVIAPFGETVQIEI